MSPHSASSRPERSKRLRLSNVRFEGWPTSNETAALSLAPRRTVLVGRNGAGKSLLIEGILRAAQFAVARHIAPRLAIQMPDRAILEVHSGEAGSPVSYRFDRTFRDRGVNEIEESGIAFERRETCSIGGKQLWRLENGAAHLPDAGQSPIPVPRGIGLLAFENIGIPFASELAELFKGVRRIEAGFPRPHGHKDWEITRRPEFESGKAPPVRPHSRVGRLAQQLVIAYDSKPSMFTEFRDIITKQLNIAKDISITNLSSSEEPGLEKTEFAAVRFDKTNIGHISDGTLRVAEIVWTLLSLRGSDTLLIEEPETGIHPGLLGRLLSVIESYSLDHQVVVSTHSIQVVNWANPSEIRLVHRQDGPEGTETLAPGLTEKQLSHLAPYLNDEGTLGDFVYSGGSDE